MLRTNLVKIIHQKFFLIFFVIGASLILIPSFYFLDIELVKGNLGMTFLRIEIVLSIISAIIFGLFLASSIYKINYFSVQNTAKGFLGGIFVTLVSGCPSCSITLAYYIGLASILSTLPYHGLELKIIGIFLMSYALYSNLKNLETCKIKKSPYYSQ